MLTAIGCSDEVADAVVVCSPEDSAAGGSATVSSAAAETAAVARRSKMVPLMGTAAAVAVLAVYIAFGLVALAIDRRALLVSALAYVLFALTFLFDRFGAVELNVALTALVIGSALLTLSAFWTPIRRAVVQPLPQDLQARLPVTAMPA